ncbi:MAG: tyrosine-protein phosphatase [Clostridiales bacterium]|nr:tyrosine-protein phosphatase [Clostridiales bacterium]
MRKGHASIAAALTGILLAVPLCACSSGVLELNDVDGFVNIHTDEQAWYLNSSDYDGITADGSVENSRPRPLRLSWSYDDCKDYTVELSLDEGFDNSLAYHTSKTYIDVYNLYLDTAYYWRVTAKSNGGATVVSEPSIFLTTGDAPRNIYVDGVTNVRDLGGWAVENSEARVKQGMIYRCGRLNKSRQSDVEIEITERGIETMHDELGIKAEIDLRRPDALNDETGGLTFSPIGSDVQYYNVPMNMDVANTNKLEGNAESIKAFFALLGDKDNYPMIFHCDIGTDRTGMCAFLINGLLGVSEEDLYRDYLFSNFGKIGGKRTLTNITDAYVKTLKAYRGGTFAEKIRNYLVDEIGVAASDIDTLSEMMHGE